MSYPSLLDDEDILYRILDAMDKYGGSFTSTLAQLTRVADPLNRRRLLSCFTEIYLRYYYEYVAGR